MRAAAPEAQRARVYSQARRHSARVRFLKRAIPIGAAVTSALVVVTFFDPFGRLQGVKVGPFSLSGTKIAMENPRMTGYRKDNRGYEVTADAAYQDIRKPTVIELERMKARVASDDNGGYTTLVAATGVFDTQSEHLELKRDIHVVTQDGQEAFLASASIDFKSGTVVSNEPVRVKMTTGTVEATGVTITDNGKSVVFSGRVHAVLDRQPDEAKKTSPRSAEPKPEAAAPARTSQADASPVGRR